MFSTYRTRNLRRQQRIERQEKLLANMNLSERKAFNIFMKLGVYVHVQLPLYRYYVDFVGVDRNFVLEVDGSSHLGREEYDQERDRYLGERGFETYRLWSDEVTEENLITIINQSERIGKEEMDRRIAKAQMI